MNNSCSWSNLVYIKYSSVHSFTPAVFQYLVQPLVWWFTLYCTRIWPMWSEECHFATWTRSHFSKAESLKNPWNNECDWSKIRKQKSRGGLTWVMLDLCHFVRKKLCIVGTLFWLERDHWAKWTITTFNKVIFQ